MWKIEALVFLSFISLPGIYSYDPKECLLDVARYMPFITRVTATNAEQKRVTVATGSIITPDSVLTTCMDVALYDTNLLQCRAIQAHYIKDGAPIDHDHFKTAGFLVDPKGCSQVRNVKSIIYHPLCPTVSFLDYMQFERGSLVYNVAVLKVNEVFRNLTEAVPTMPFVSDIATQLEHIDKFNSIRIERGLMPTFEGDGEKIQFMEYSAVRPVPLQTECKPYVCSAYPERHADCMATMANHTGYALCVRRVIQKQQGITWADYFNRDEDVSDANRRYNCSVLNYMVGAPVISRGVAIGIITQCHWWGYTVASIYSLRLFLHKVVDTGYTVKIMIHILD